jgi:hypothetical protein
MNRWFAGLMLTSIVILGARALDASAQPYPAPSPSTSPEASPTATMRP